MALCDILVCLDATAAGGGRLEPAFNLAQADKAHLTAVYALPEPADRPPRRLASAFRRRFSGRFRRREPGPWMGCR